MLVQVVICICLLFFWLFLFRIETSARSPAFAKQIVKHLFAASERPVAEGGLPPASLPVLPPSLVRGASKDLPLSASHMVVDERARSGSVAVVAAQQHFYEIALRRLGPHSPEVLQVLITFINSNNLGLNTCVTRSS
jgi:hypothetical protein